ncbi:MAG: hypothetical protein V1820_03420 [archaeon]
MLSGGFLSIERIFVLIVVIFGLLWASIKVRKYLAYLRETGMKGFGATLIVLGGILFVFASVRIGGLYLFQYLTETITSEQMLKLSLWLVIFGAGFILLDWIVRKFQKRQLLGLEDERREYITRVRKGIKIEDAEKIAFENVKKVLNPPGLKLIAAEKEFKTWRVYMKDTIGKKYMVALDIEGEIMTTETMDELPSYLGGIN